MPELPEVQTVINALSNKIIGRKIISIDVRLPKLIKNVSVNQFKQIITNASFVRLERIGKYIIFHLDNDYVMAVHLRMEGKFFVNSDQNEVPFRNVHLIFKLNDAELCYCDSRQFGTFHLYKNSTYLHAKEIKKIGIDPLNPKFDWHVCKELFIKTQRPIKTVLLDQSLISGIGNIYANEILFAAKISPFKPTKDLTDQELQQIAKYAKSILQQAIAYKGTTIFSFEFDHGHSGGFQKMLRVHLRSNQPCFSCQQPIKVTKINTRSTYFCSHCQR